MTIDGATQAAKETVIRPATGLVGRGLRDLWPYRELAGFLVWRDVKIRYKQTIFGGAWAVLQPFMLMVVFSLFLGHLAKLPSQGVPYPVFVYAALVPWTMFASALQNASDSLVSNSALVSKVYFPRLILPLAAALATLVDFLIAFVIVLVLMAFYGIAPTPSVLAVPLLTLLALVAASGVGIWLSALSVKYRDFKHTVPFTVQFWLFATPVAYSGSLVPERFQSVYGLNPMASVAEGFRWALLGTSAPSPGMLALSALTASIVLASGLLYFQRVERSFADFI